MSTLSIINNLSGNAARAQLAESGAKLIAAAADSCTNLRITAAMAIALHNSYCVKKLDVPEKVLSLVASISDSLEILLSSSADVMSKLRSTTYAENQGIFNLGNKPDMELLTITVKAINVDFLTTTVTRWINDIVKSLHRESPFDDKHITSSVVQLINTDGAMVIPSISSDVKRVDLIDLATKLTGDISDEIVGNAITATRVAVRNHYAASCDNANSNIKHIYRTIVGISIIGNTYGEHTEQHNTVNQIVVNHTTTLKSLLSDQREIAALIPTDKTAPNYDAKLIVLAAAAMDSDTATQGVKNIVDNEYATILARAHSILSLSTTQLIK
jgi:hypothetical protein